MNSDLWIVMVFLFILGSIIFFMGLLRYGEKITLSGFVVAAIGILVGLISFYV